MSGQETAAQCCDLANYPLGCPIHQDAACEHTYARAVYGDWNICPDCGARFRGGAQ